MKYLVYILIIVFITACGEYEATFSDSSNKTKDGTLEDSVISGVRYYNTQMNIDGVTDVNGTFKYYEDKPISFSIGKIFLGEVKTVNIDAKVYPNDLLNIPRDEINNEKSINMILFLQSLDEDSNVENGITISNETIQTFENLDQTINIQQQNLTQIKSLLSLANKNMIDADKALEHIISTLKSNDVISITDLVPPNISLLSKYISKDDPKIYGTIDDVDSVVSVEINNHIYPTTINTTTKIWTTQSIEGLEQNEYNIVIRAVDRSQNMSSLKDTIIIDNNAADISVDNSEFYIKDSSSIISGTIDDNSSDINVEILDKNYTAINNHNGTWSFSNDIFNILDEKVYQAKVYAKDQANNISSKEFTIVIDRTPPIITLDTQYYTSNTPIFSGTTNEKLKLLKISIAGINYSATIEDNQWKTSPVDTLALKSYELNIIAYDYAGNKTNIVKTIYIQN